MEQVVIDLWPYLVGPVILAIGWLFREVYVMKANMKVLEKTYENMQNRLDAHSKKQDEFFEKMSMVEKEVIKQVGSVRADISSLSSDVKGLSNLILASDKGLRIEREK